MNNNLNHLIYEIVDNKPVLKVMPYIEGADVVQMRLGCDFFETNPFIPYDHDFDSMNEVEMNENEYLICWIDDTGLIKDRYDSAIFIYDEEPVGVIKGPMLFEMANSYDGSSRGLTGDEVEELSNILTSKLRSYMDPDDDIEKPIMLLEGFSKTNVYDDTNNKGMGM